MKTIYITGNTAVQPTASLPLTVSKNNYLQRFLQFAEKQQPNRFGWLAFALFAQGCLLAPVTILAIIHNGNSPGLWMACVLTFVVTEVTNLAAMPTKITIPIFFAGAIMDLFLIALAFIM